MNKKEENNVERLACGKLLYPEQITVRWPIPLDSDLGERN